ncbi:Adam [Trypoxylus dichotomus]
MESWDDDNFEPKEVTPAIIQTNKWEGEDEDDDVKDNWEDEDEEQKPEEPKVVVPTKTKKKTDIIAEKEKLKREEQEKRLKEIEESEELTPDERHRLQRESDLQAALETTFDGSITNTGLDSLNPATKEEFDQFADALSNKVQSLSKSSEFPAFAETVVRNICASMSSGDIKKIKNTIDNLYLEKQKIEKGDKAKKSKGKGKAKLKLDNENQYSAYVDDYDEFDDFM